MSDKTKAPEAGQASGGAFDKVQSDYNTTPHPYLELKGIDLADLQAACKCKVEIRPTTLGNFRGLAVFRELLAVDGSAKGFERILSERISFDADSKPNDKFTQKGSTVSGTFTPIGFHPSDLMSMDCRIIVCAGLADGYRLHQATGEPVACGSGEGNIRSIAEAIRPLNPSILVAVDNDEAGKRAGAASGFEWAHPISHKDWSDVYQADGLQAVRDSLAVHIKKAGQEAPPIADDAAAQAVDLFDNLTPPPFPVDLLPPAIAGYARDEAELIGVDPAVIALAAIGAAAACIDDRIEIQPKRHDTGWREQARLWVGIIGDPSAKKSPGIKKAMAPLFKIDQKWRDETNQATAEWLKACEDTPKGEEEPPAPIGKRLILNDATVEKMGDIMSKSEPRGMLSYQDELSGWLASMDAYKNGAGGKDKAAWLEAYNGGPKAIDRIARGSTFVENWSACVLGGIQPSVVQAYAQSTNHDGMLQRFILVKAGEARLGADRRPNLAARERYNFIMEQMAGTQAAGDTVVTLSEDAHKIREALDEKLHRLTVNHPNKFLAAALGKWNGLFARLLLTFHCIESAAAQGYPVSNEVSGETARRVADLMWFTLLPHAVAFYQGLDPIEDTACELAALILAHEWARFTVKRDLNRNWKASRKLKPWELEGTLDRLEAFGWIFPEPLNFNEKGKPAAYRVNPGVHTRFNEQAERERERRKEVTAMMADLKQ
jgi:hypothetical protein